MARVEEIEECVLEDFRPDFEIAKLGAFRGELANDGVCNVADSGLDW